MVSKTFSKDEFGDFQTPPNLVAKIISYLSKNGWSWGRILEPTCGVGNFIHGLAESSNNIGEIRGIEICGEYAQIAKKNENDRIKIENKNIFSMDLKKDITWKTKLPLLVIGNPPWVTNSNMGSMNGNNLPKKSNIKKVSGFDALTGASNFDISEHIILKIMIELKEEAPVIAMLCKTAVARNIVSYCRNEGLPIHGAKIVRIDAFKWFGAATDACLFVVFVGGKQKSYDIEAYDSLSASAPTNRIAFHGGNIISNEKTYSALSHLDGVFPFIWRQGIKHDAVSVVELKKDGNGTYRNKTGELVDVEDEYVYPLVKSSGLNKPDVSQFKNWVIVPQKHLHEDVSHLRNKAPKLWSYLNQHKDVFKNRKSSIYENKPEFTYFGLGKYSFSGFKVAVSGLYKEPRFRVLKKYCNKPVMVDDTCYFIPCEKLEPAESMAEILNSSLVLDFLKAITFSDSMRPITKRVLQRIDINAAIKSLNANLTVPSNPIFYGDKSSQKTLDIFQNSVRRRC